MQPTSGILRVLQAVSWLWVYTALKQSPRSAHQRVTPAVRQPKSKNKRAFESPSRFFVEFKKQILVWLFLFSGGLGKFSFFVHFVSGFPIVRFISLSLLFQLSFSRLVKVLVEYGLRVLGMSFTQVTLGKVPFSGNVSFRRSQVSNIGFCVLAKVVAGLVHAARKISFLQKRPFFNGQGFCFASVLVSHILLVGCQSCSSL